MAIGFWTCLTYAYTKSVIINLTLKSGRNVYWQQIQLFARHFDIPVEYHHTEMRVHFPNGSLLFLMGADKKDEIEKLRGGSYKVSIVDECKSYPPAILEELIRDVLRPAAIDCNGRVFMIGTPGNILSGPFYEATYPGYTRTTDDGKRSYPVSRFFEAPERYWLDHPDEIPEWSRHAWTIQDNTSKPEMWSEALLDKLMNRWDDDHPTWQREYLGKWMPAENAFVYAYASLCRKIEAGEELSRVNWRPTFDEKHTKHGLDMEIEWRYVLGLDHGFEDDFAQVVLAYSPNDGAVRHIHDFKCPHLTVSYIAGLIKECHQEYRLDAMVTDVGAMKALVETLNQEYGLFLVPAEKVHKNDYIELINSDFHSGLIKIIPGSDLALELETLQWDLSIGSKQQLARTGRLKESKELPNHLCDALLYALRYCYHHYAKPRTAKIEVGTPSWWEAEEGRMIDEFLQNHYANRDKPLWEKLRDRARSPLGKNYGTGRPQQAAYYAPSARRGIV